VRDSLSPAVARSRARVHRRGGPLHRVLIARQTNVPELSDSAIRRAVRAALAPCRAGRVEVGVALLNGPSVRKLNARYLRRRGQTDVLAFDLSDRKDRSTGLLGEIVVNVELARRRAARYRSPARSEIMLYILHGCLHLVGYDDRDPAEAVRMHCREDDLLERLGYGRTYTRVGEVPRSRQRRHRLVRQ